MVFGEYSRRTRVSSNKTDTSKMTMKEYIAYKIETKWWRLRTLLEGRLWLGWGVDLTALVVIVIAFLWLLKYGCGNRIIFYDGIRTY